MTQPKAIPGLSPERVLWSAAVVLGASLPHWPALSSWVPLLLCLCIAWRIAAAVRGWRLPNALLRVTLAVAAFAAVLAEYRTINGIEAGSALLIVMVALKFLESQNYRDQLVLMMIAYFLVFVALLAEHGLLTIVYLIGFVWLTTVGLLQLSRQGPMPRLGPSLKLAGRLLLQALPIMVVLFLLFPRLPAPLWALPGDTSSGRTGLDDSMSPGDLTALGLSDEVAFRVEFFGKRPRADQMYWRGPVLSNFDGRTWTRNRGMRRRVDRTLEYSGDPIEYRVMLEPHGRRWTFALDMPRRWSEDKNIFMSSDYQLRLRFTEPVHSHFDYRVTSYPEYRALEQLSDAEKLAYTRLPAGSNPRTRALAGRWRDQDLAPRQIIQRALDLFRENQFYYTLTPPPLGIHPADDFLFKTREGFCEHYASAFTVLMRAAGLPARVVTGYQGGELNPVGNYFIVRQMNAHAWSEVWLAGEGWIRVDPTAVVAPSRISLGLADASLARQGSGSRALPWARQLSLAWDAINTYWQDWVVGYGPELQQGLLAALGFEHADVSMLIALMTVTMLSLLAALALYLGWIYRRRPPPDPAFRHFDAACRRLARLIPPRRPSESPTDFARRAAAALPSASAEIDGITAAYLKARYEPDRDRAHLHDLERLVRGFHPARS